MADPPRDAHGKVIPHDDPAIVFDDGLIRYIPTNQVVFDQNIGRSRLSSGAFSESSEPPGGMSVDLERLMANDGLPSLGRLPHPPFGAVRLIAGEMRALGHQVGSDPLPHNPYHGAVWNIGKSKRARRRIMERIAWLKKPEGLE